MFSSNEKKTSNIKHVDATALCTKISESANQTIAFFESKLQKDGSYGEQAKDLACYFKSPMLFLAANKPHIAIRILNYIKKKFMSVDGDFQTTDSLKSINGAYIEYWSYTNGWIVRAAQQLNCLDISFPGYQYLSQYNLGEKAGFLTNKADREPQVVDVLTVAHHGLINFERGNLDIAISAGNFLCEAIRKQSNLKVGFYLRLDRLGNLITEFAKDQALFYLISATEPNQLHFMIGYPSAYLAILYKKTQKPEFLAAAVAYLDFSLSCDKNVYACDFSHKIAWAASLAYECTGDEKYLKVIDEISNHFISKQKNGMWFPEDINSSYDQSAEIACWFLDIVKNIKSFKKKISLESSKPANTGNHGSWTTKAIKLGFMALAAGLGVYAFCRSRSDGTTAPQDVVAPPLKQLNSIR